jgi:tryptophan halogenase
VSAADPGRPIQSVAIVGNDAIAWLTACALARAFRHRKLEVQVLETTTAGAPRGRWTLPSQRGMHALLGIQEADLVRRTGATFKLATEHIGWQGAGSRFLHAHGELGRELAGVPFYKLLLREGLAGRADPPANYSLAAAAVALGRFARPIGDGPSLKSSFTYGFHLDEIAYVTYLRAHAGKLGVTRIPGPPAGVERQGANIGALKLSDGSRLVADLFIDCTGRDAAVIGTAGARIDWSASLPCDRMLVARAPAMAQPPAVTRTVAASAGWQWRLPLARETLVGYAWSSAFSSEEIARAELRSAEPAAGEATLTASGSSGRRASFWEGNCIALGSAAVELEPLAGADLHVAQLGVGTLIELFPLDTDCAIERAEYNRVTAEHIDGVRDFTLAHYLAGRPRAGAFWEAVRAARPPERLGRKLDLFRANGRIELLDGESLEETDWAWLLLGAGCRVDALEQSIDLALAGANMREVAALRAEVRQLAESMPRHIDYVGRLAELAARASANQPT